MWLMWNFLCETRSARLRTRVIADRSFCVGYRQAMAETLNVRPSTVTSARQIMRCDFLIGAPLDPSSHEVDQATEDAFAVGA